jgi:hypothetical protein
VIVRIALRCIAAAISLTAAADPSLTRTQSVREPLWVVASGDEALPAAERFQRLIAPAEARLILIARGARAAACPSEGACVLVSAGEIPSRITSGADVLGGVWDAPDRAIKDVDSPRQVHLDTPASLRVTLNRDARVELFDGAVRLGAADGRVDAPAEIGWLPLAEGPRRLTVVADGDSADVAVLVTRERVVVAVLEPEPSWHGTFVRRALESDSRFEVTGRTRVAPSVDLARGGVSRVTPETLRDVRAIILTAPDALPAAELALLDRFVRDRGGSLVVLLDRRPTVRILDLLPGIADVRLESQPIALGTLRASEFLVFREEPGVAVLPGMPLPVIVSQGRGRGTVVADGASDAWKYRDPSGAFDRFWAAVVWEAATAAGPPLRVLVDPLVVNPGEEAVVDVELQGIERSGTTVVAAAAVTCGGTSAAVRLWPQPRRGAFRGVVRVDAPGSCELQVRAGARIARSPFLVASKVHRPASFERFDAAIRAHGGAVARAGEADDVIRRIRESLPSRSEAVAVYPMRSPLWLIPLTAALGVEWWLRRRAGLR